MEDEATCPTESIGDNCLIKRAILILAQVAEILIVVVTVLWEILLATFRLFIPTPQKPIKGEIVLITGAGHGLGKELALLYAAENATVVCLDINEKTNKETVETIAKLGYGTAHAYTCDISNSANVQDVIERVRKDVGEITILINNAGIMPTRSLTDYTIEETEKTVNTNLLSYIWLLKAILPYMLKNNYGHIVAISSLCGVEGMVNLVPYCATKFGVRGLMEALRKELDFYQKSHIKTTVMYPYIMDTGLAKKPKIRFPSLFPILKPTEVAKYVMKCQRKDVYESTVPCHYGFLFNIAKSLPHKAQKILNEFAHIYIESD